MYQGNVSLRNIIDCIEDPLDNRGKKYDIHETIILLIVGCICCRKQDYTNIAFYLKQREDELKKYLTLKNGIPSHDTMNRHMQRIDENKLIYALCDWFCCIVNNKYPHIIIDGKALRAACDKVHDKHVPYVLNALSEITKTVIMQIGIDAKTNEITAIPEILNLLDIKDKVVTIDAIGTQKEIVEKIVDKGGYYVLPVKENQKILKEDLELYINDVIDNKSKEVETYITKDDIDKHGRETTRRYDFIKKSEYSNDHFKSITGVGRVVRTRIITKKEEDGSVIEGESTTQTLYYITNASDLDVKKFAGFVRKHWTIENSLHWVLDDSFKEDRSTIKLSRNNASLIRKTAYNIVRLFMNKKEDEYNFERAMIYLAFNLPVLFGYIDSPVTI